MESARSRWRELAQSRAAAFAAAVIAPLLLTLVLSVTQLSNPHNYVFLYLGIVAALGIAAGSGPAFVAAALSFLAVDFVFIRPFLTLAIASSDDVVNMVVFFGAAGLVGTLGSRRRAALLRTRALADELQEANIELARLNREQAEAARLAGELAEKDRLLAVLEETDRLRHELLGNVSHELRTPLATILTATTALSERAGLPEGMHDDLGGIAAEARRLNRLVSDMLDMARIQGGAMELHLDDVDVRDAVKAAVARLHRTSPKRMVKTQLAGLPDVTADWDRLGQVLDNLLGNADRHGGGGPIEVTATREDNRVVVRVVDGGPGVADDLRERIFDRFVRGDAPDGESVAGTGLGLAIVRGLVEAQGGTVWLEDGPGGRFAFSLPAVPSTEVAE